MKKQFTKIKIAAENLSRSNKTDCKDFELEIIEKQVDKYRDTIEKILRKLPAVSSSSAGNNNAEELDKRIKKNAHYKIGQALDESARELGKDMPLQFVLANSGELEKSIAECIVENELETENKVVRRLRNILDKEIQEISTLKRNVSRTLQEYTSLKRSYEAAIRLDEPPSKVKHIKAQQEECEVKLEKERDMWAAQMFELIAKEDEIVDCIRDYVLNQRNYHERALQRVNDSLARIQDTIQTTEKLRFGTSLKEHLSSSHREIAFVIELCVCCLIEHGMYEEGLLRVGCATTKLRRMKHALEAQYVKTPLPLDYQDPHVIGCILKLYLRELPEPLLTYTFYKDFIRLAERGTEAERKAEIKAILKKLPKENYVNLRYLTRFLWLVTQNVEQNKMSSQNLAIVMSPNMLWPRIDKTNAAADYLGQVNSSSAANIIVELLISQWDYFFEDGVDFFVTLQRHKLYVEGKSKSNSSNEHLDKHDGGEATESPRYGTIRRQKANAPSPPTSKSHEGVHVHTNGEATQRIHVKELFPQPQSQPQHQSQPQQQPQQQQQPQPVQIEKPEKPPLPKLPQFQQTYTSVATYDAQSPAAKPVPMTRTQFFGLDNLPSPVADRKSNDSVNSLTFKPDLPQKPKIPKRPMVLSLGNAAATIINKSDDELTPTQTHIDNGGSIVRYTTEKFVEKLRQEKCDNNGITTNNANKENNDNQQQHTHQQLIDAEQNANAVNTTTTAATTNNMTSSTIMTSNINNHAAHAVTAAAVPPPPPAQLQQTPVTPISPNMFHIPKRPTVPAPPPPTATNVKKQTD